jgi:hypothetical protein
MPKKTIVDGKVTHVQLFENPVLEWLSRIHPSVPLIIWGPVALFLVWLGYHEGVSAGLTAGLALFGLLCWTLAEYVLHRWIFHWQPGHEKVREIYYPVHNLHHEVQEKDRLVTPPLMAVPLWLLFMGLFYMLLGTPTLFPFFGGFTIGYLCYDYVHYYVHYGKPKSAYWRTLRKRHLQHHFACEDRWFGVSSSLWDFVFRTHVPKGQSPARVGKHH